MTPSPGDALTSAQRIKPRLAARAEQYDRSGQFPVDDFEDLRRAELMGLMVPVRLGGIGAGFADYVQVAMTLAEGNGATALVYNMHSSIIGGLATTPDDMARAMGADEGFFVARDQWLKAAQNGAFFAVAMSERSSGSRISAACTTYEKVHDGYRIKGSKTFVSGAGFGDFYLIAARNANEDSPDVSHFMVPDGDGVGVEKTWDSLGMRATGSHDIHIDTVVAEDALIGAMEGLALPLAMLMPQWLVASYSAVYVGVAQSAVDAAAEHVAKRELAHLPSVRARIGRADAAVHAARLTVNEAARQVDAAPGTAETNRSVYRAKLLAGQTAMDVAASMLEAAGTSATRKGHPLERIYRDARCGSLQPATSDVCADWLGISVLGGDPELDATVSRW